MTGSRTGLPTASRAPARRASREFPFLAQRMFNTPLAIAPSALEVPMAYLAGRMGLSLQVEGRPLAFSGWDDFDNDEDDGYHSDGRAHDDGYDLLGPVARIPVRGTLVKKSGALRPWCGMTGYDGLRHAYLAAMGDPAVRAVMIDIDSPGGEAAGLFDLVDTLSALRGEKPVHAILNENAYSAAYAIATVADKIWVPRTGGTGSVGVICAHVDYSQQLDKSGIKVTFIHYGARKADGAAELPLSDVARDRLQADVDAIGEMFVDTVAKNRGLAVSAVKATEALTYQGPTGLAVGFADAVAAPDHAFRELQQLAT